MSERAAAALVVLVGVLTGCGGGDETDAVRVEATEYAYELPDRVDGGLVAMELSNGGDEVHEWAFGRLRDGRSEAEFRQELLGGKLQDFSTIDPVASVPAVTPGTSVGLARELEPGTYLLFCRMPAPSRHAHYQLGMIDSFIVEGTSASDPPSADGVIAARERGFRVPALGPGTHTLELRNTADDPREFKLLSLRQGKEPKDLQAWFGNRFRGEPPADLLGIVGPLLPGEVAYATVSFEAGRTYHLFDGPHRVAAHFDVG